MRSKQMSPSKGLDMSKPRPAIAVRGFVAMLALAMGGFATSQAQDGPDTAELQRQLEALRAENAALRAKLEQQAVAPEPVADVADAKPHDTVQEPESIWDQLDASAEATCTFGKPWGTIEYQFDTRGFNTLNLTGSSPLPYGFNIWGFIDLQGNDGGPGSRYDTANYFYEIDIKREIWDRVGVIGEINDATGPNNNLTRLGVFYTPDWDVLQDLNTWLFLKAFPVESDGAGYQFSFAWNTRFPDYFDDRWSIGGFVDFNFDSGPSEDDLNIVSDIQVRYRLIENLSLLSEFRINKFLGNNKDFGVGFGVQYQF